MQKYIPLTISHSSPILSVGQTDLEMETINETKYI